MKEYGIDLEQQLKVVEQKKKSIENKIKKRAKFLIKEVKKNGEIPELFKDLAIDSLTSKALLFVIKRMEQDYVNKSTQISLYK